QDRLARKEDQIKENIRYTLRKTTYVATTENLGLIFKDEIYEIADVLNVNFNIYDLEGGLIKSSRPKFGNDSISMCLPPSVLNNL
ncbi:two-component sensor histidine kinase, partial [Aquimarina celericrescens]|nr:two-component sensor histidine kinase [Aquimarina celericrescens]